MNGDGSLPSLAPAALQVHLRTAVFGHRVFYYPTIGSTNDRALDLASAGEAEGAVILAEEQTGGRGRRERTWHSPARMGIYVSLILRPCVPAMRAPLFTFTAAVAVVEALREVGGLPATIKWPNDVVVAGRKIAGILAETRGSDPMIREMVLGLGVNVNQRREDFAPEVLDRATSMRIELGGVIDRAIILGAFLGGFERRYSRLIAGHRSELLREWESLSALPPGHIVVVEGPSGRSEGRMAGVDEEGALLLTQADGCTARVPFGEIVESGGA
ncbi:MAG TPA: biotin--[acetyl-CoA-carboxylase] ligase [Candidatus Polarisedimenticolia bacterium]|nr:biotin--[acetyl-CoA-carboxylase] ligase [Candidatus Polarisedimenticolia bacterium]